MGNLCNQMCVVDTNQVVSQAASCMRKCEDAAGVDGNNYEMRMTDNEQRMESSYVYVPDPKAREKELVPQSTSVEMPGQSCEELIEHHSNNDKSESKSKQHRKGKQPN